MNIRKKLRLTLAAARGDANARSVILWRLRKADPLLFRHNLLPGKIVYDVGGYKGDWTFGMNEKYASEYHIFEPHPSAVSVLQKRFEKCQNINIHKFAIGGETNTVALSSNDEGSSIMGHNPENALIVQLKNICELLEEQDHHVSLMKLNIEGAEYELLERLLASESRHRCETILVQFHFRGPESEYRYNNIARLLSHSHRIVWRYPFLWEMWEPLALNRS
jgi:FkbM family methyltransferase